MSCFSPYVPTLFHTMVSKFIFEVWLCNLCYATKQSLKVMWTTDLNLLINQKPPLQTLKCSSRESVLIVFQVLWIQTEQLCANIQTKYRHFLLHSKPQNKTHLASETKSFTSNWAFSFVYILVFAFRDTCFRLNHQLPSFALEVLGCHQWRRVFFFGSQVSVFVSFSLRPKLIPLSVNQWNRQHAFGLRWCSCTSLLRSKLAFQSGPSLCPDRHKDTWASDDAYGRSAVGVAIKASRAELGSVLLTDVPQLETSLEAAGAWPPPLTCDPQTLCQVCFGML